ncbi:hypothetical protein V7x_40940 [Crateriforma conspicua]|uniref:Uncharacterized protein n=1 Tax=Crateriforma conspicua TaxID=2527996 RepID=A0A5C6FJD7_9PLAN|nr:hypothetical protein V7x_40940 [Crateriforma conspicua]
MSRSPRFASDRHRRRGAIRHRNNRLPHGKRGERDGRTRPRALDREKTFNIYVLIFAAPIAVVLVLCISVWAHDRLIPGFSSFIADSLRRYGTAVLDRPTLLFVLPLTVLFIWSVPWEAIIAELDEDESTNSHVRGRQLRNLDKANREAYRKRNRRQRLH